jgi:hypothetical protein
MLSRRLDAINLDSDAQRGTVGGTGVCARCSPSRASNSARVTIDVRSHGRTDASFQVPSAVRLNEGHVGRRSLTSAPIRRGPQGCSIAVPWRERPRDLTGSAISPAATAEVAHATLSLPQPESAISISRPRSPPMCRESASCFHRPSDSIVRFAFARSRRSALLRPRRARLPALTARSANLSAQVPTAVRVTGLA